MQAEKVALNSILSKSEIIVSSPYPRALQTAAIISRETGIKLNVEMDLREWEPDKTFQFKSSEEADALYRISVIAKEFILMAKKETGRKLMNN